MGCATGRCSAVNDTPEIEPEPGLRCCHVVSELVGKSGKIDHGACCAFCEGIELDPTLMPVAPHELLQARSGCPISAIAYRARKLMDGGATVQVQARGGQTPQLIVDGKKIDALAGYKTGKCGCQC